MQYQTKISIIGSGNIGGSLAYLLSQQKQNTEIILFDKKINIAAGKALDIAQGNHHNNIMLKGSDNYNDISNSDIIVITAGLARKPGMSRDDLLKANADIIKDIGYNIKKYSPNSFIIVVTNPLDAMVWLLQKTTQLNPKKIVGMAGTLDSARLNLLLSQEFKISLSNVNSLVIGSHGDKMLPLIRYSYIGNIPIPEMIASGFSSTKNIKEIIYKTRHGGAEIVELLKNGSAFYGPTTAIIKIINAYINDSNEMISCASYLSGEYGYNNIYAGVPSIINRNGVKNIIELKLLPEEKKDFAESIETIKELINKLQS